MIMDHELEKIREAASPILRQNASMVRPVKQPEHLGQDDEAVG
jgi:hypothetical protein